MHISVTSFTFPMSEGFHTGGPPSSRHFFVTVS